MRSQDLNWADFCVQGRDWLDTSHSAFFFMVYPLQMRPLWVCLEMRSLSKPLGKRWSAMTGFWSSKCSYCLYIYIFSWTPWCPECLPTGGSWGLSFGLYAWSSRSLKWHRPEIGARFTAVSMLLVRLNSVWGMVYYCYTMLYPHYS